MRRIVCLLGLLVLVFCPRLVSAQGIIVPERIPMAGSYSVKSINIDVNVKDQVADVQLSQVFRNTGSADVEVQYLFPIPPDAVINQFTLMVDGKEFPAKMYSREEAERIYEGIVRSKRDPALLEYVGYGVLKTNVFPLPAGAERKVTLKYSQVCRRDREVTEFAFPLGAGKHSAKPIEELKVTAHLSGSAKIKSVYSPNYSIDVQRPTDQSAVANITQNNVVPTDDFRLFWSLSEKPIGATLLTYRPDEKEDGYFLLLASPEVKAPDAAASAKTVVFVLDRSGSMAGKKIEQARNALKFVLNNLRDGDTFNIVVYDSNVESFKPELQRFDSKTRAEALAYVDSIRDGGSTNIDGALKRSFELIGDTGRPSYMIFLTDGLPTAGVVNQAQIAENAKNANKTKARLFAFGVGFDVNARLLDRLTTEHGGVSEYVRPNEDIETAVAKFYGKLTAPVATALKLDIPGGEINRTYPKELPDLFSGGQVMAVGRYHGSGDAKIKLSGKVGDKDQTFEFPATLVKSSGDETYAFVEKLWATRRVGEIINELDLKGKNQELIDELVRLSTKHGILTPYTAFLADERTVLHAVRENGKIAADNTFEKKDSLARNESGAAGVNLRAGKQAMQQQATYNGGQQGWMDADGKWNVSASCQVVGNKAMFRRENRWVDPSVTPDDEKKAEVVEQFSDKFFELARNNGNLRKYFALPEGCTVRVDGKVYQVNAQQEKKG